MPAQALYRRWRPQTFEDVKGQEHVTRTLRNAMRSGRLAHAYLFTGLRGTGKTSVARILAKAINCTDPEVAGGPPCNACESCISVTDGRALDLFEIDAASNTGVDDVRDLREKVGFSPSASRYKVYIIDEVHMLSTAAFNALLKTLEEPPPHAVFILATTEPQKVLPTIVSRCQRFDFRRVPLGPVVDKLTKICEAEDMEFEVPALEAIARAGTGSFRDAESLLDQVMAMGEAITLEGVRAALGTPGDEAVDEIIAAVADGNAAHGIQALEAALDQGADVRQLRELVLERLRSLLLLHVGAEGVRMDATEERIADWRALAAGMDLRALVGAIRRFGEAKPSPDSTQPALALELALVESILEGHPGGPRTVAGSSNTRTIAASPAAATVTTGRAGGSPEVKSSTSETIPPEASDEESSGSARSSGGDEADDGKKVGVTEADRFNDNVGDGAGEAGAGCDTSAAPAGAVQVDEKSLAKLLEAWDSIVTAVAARDRNTAALLKDCRPIAADAASATLGFFYEFHARRAAEGPRSEAIRRALSSVLGHACDLRITVVQQTADEAAARPKTKAERLGSDPVVRHAIEELGGRVGGVRSRPDETKKPDVPDAPDAGRDG